MCISLSMSIFVSILIPVYISVSKSLYISLHLICVDFVSQRVFLQFLSSKTAEAELEKQLGQLKSDLEVHANQGHWLRPSFCFLVFWAWLLNRWFLQRAQKCCNGFLSFTGILIRHCPGRGCSTGFLMFVNMSGSRNQCS